MNNNLEIEKKEYNRAIPEKFHVCWYDDKGCFDEDFYGWEDIDIIFSYLCVPWRESSNEVDKYGDYMRVFAIMTGGTERELIGKEYER